VRSALAAPLLALLAACAPAAGEPPARGGGGGGMVDVAAAAGLVHAVVSGGPGKRHIRETVGQGACWIDHDADGDPDLFLPSGASRMRESYAAGDPALVPWRFYVNRGGRFEEAAARLGLDVAAWGVGCAVGDVDGDGFDDLFVTTATGADRLLRNRRGRGFADRTVAAGLGEPGFSTGALFADLDGDGDLDLFVTRYLDESRPPPGPCRWRGLEVACGPNGYPRGEPRLYLNDGSGRFVAATPEAGIAGHAGYGLAAISLDADLDGRPDLFVANDSSPNHLFLNRGGGQFEEAGLLAGVALSDSGTSQAGMGVDAGDLDGDGLEDLVVTNFSDDVQREQPLGCDPPRIAFASLFGPTGQALPDPLDRPIGDARRGVMESHAPATLERDLRDAGAHRPGADHRDDRPIVRALAHRPSLSDATGRPRLPCPR